MKRCAICDNPLPFGRSKYCGDSCYFVSKRGFNKRETVKASKRAWRDANRDRFNAMRRDWYARKKAEKFAAVLEKVQS